MRRRGSRHRRVHPGCGRCGRHPAVAHRRRRQVPGCRGDGRRRARPLPFQRRRAQQRKRAYRQTAAAEKQDDGRLRLLRPHGRDPRPGQPHHPRGYLHHRLPEQPLHRIGQPDRPRPRRSTAPCSKSRNFTSGSTGCRYRATWTTSSPAARRRRSGQECPSRHRQRGSCRRGNRSWAPPTAPYATTAGTKKEKKVKNFYRSFEIMPDPKMCLLEQGILCMGSATVPAAECAARTATRVPRLLRPAARREGPRREILRARSPPSSTAKILRRSTKFSAACRISSALPTASELPASTLQRSHRS